MDHETGLKNRVERYQQKIFALVLYLIGGDRDKAYDVAVSGFVEALRAVPEDERDRLFLTQLATSAVRLSRKVKVVPYFDDTGFQGLPSEKRNTLFLVREALGRLSFENRAVILLREQLQFSYKDIAAALGLTESEARARTLQAQMRFREKVQEVLTHAG